MRTDVCMTMMIPAVVAAASQLLALLFVNLAVNSSITMKFSPSSSSVVSKLITKTRFILMDTHHAGNVGASARAIKTMGFDELVLVSPHDPKVLNRQRTKEGASGATDVLKGARICDTLQQATEGTDIWCATGMPNDMYRARTTKRYFSPRVYFDQLLHPDKQQLRLSASDDTNPAETEHSKNQELRISFIFGNEQLGMKEQDTDLCHVVLGIPTNPKFGSLNLASAVQLIAYDWRQAIGGFDDQSLSTESSAST